MNENIRLQTNNRDHKTLPEKNQENRLAQNKKNISTLLVDDEPVLLEIVRMFLEKEGDIFVRTCKSAREALDLIEDFHFDVIVSDYNMPCMSGYDLLRELRMNDNNTPFILFTSFSTDCIEKELFEDKNVQYLQKNNEPKPMFDIMREMIRNVFFNEPAVDNDFRERSSPESINSTI